MKSRSLLFAVLTMCVSGVLSISTFAQTVVVPAAPVLYSSDMPNTSGYKVVNVSGGQSVQSAIDSASCGTIINLQAGATFGAFHLTSHNCDASHWIIIQTSLASKLPDQFTRISTTDAVNMPKVQTGSVNTPAISAYNLGTSFYRLVGLEVELSPSLASMIAHGSVYEFDNALVLLGSTEKTHALEPHDVILDRCYIHGTTTAELRRGVQLNGSNLAIINSRIDEIHESQNDSQAIATWGGTGPYKIVNNFIEAATENFLSGGATPSVAGEIPSDIEFRHNYVSKKLSWNTYDPSYAGIGWSIKNQFELKFAKRVLVEGNYFMHTWAGGQTGRAILFTPRCQAVPATSGGTGVCAVTNAAVDDVNFGYNVVYDMTTGYEASGKDSNEAAKTLRSHRLWIHDNVFSYINRNSGGNGWAHEEVSGIPDLTVEHNTSFGMNVFMYFDTIGTTWTHLTVRNELGAYGMYGLVGTGACGTGTHCLAAATLGSTYTFAGNILFNGKNAYMYPTTNQTCQTAMCFPTQSGVLFTNYATCNPTSETNLDLHGCALASGSPYKNQGTDGRDPGADIPTLLLKLQGVAVASTGTSGGSTGTSGSGTSSGTGTSGGSTATSGSGTSTSTSTSGTSTGTTTSGDSTSTSTSGSSIGTTTSGDSAGTSTSGSSTGTTTSGDSAGTSTSGSSTGTTTSGDSTSTSTSGSSTGTTTSGDSAGTTTSGDSTTSIASGDSAGTTTSGDSAGTTTSGDSAGAISTSDGSTVTKTPDGSTRNRTSDRRIVR